MKKNMKHYKKTYFKKIWNYNLKVNNSKNFKL